MSVCSDRPFQRLCVLALYAIVVLVGSGSPRIAGAANGDCGQPLSAGPSPTATDALFILNVAVGVGVCDLCVCDTDDSGATTATDALKTLRAAVGVSVEIDCPPCGPVSLCDGLLSIDASGEPFDTLDIGDIPNAIDSVWAIITPEAGESGVGGVLLDDDNGDRLMVPTHPNEPISGGLVTVSITDGTKVCPIGSLEILPLPEAPADTSAKTLDAFLFLIDAVAGDFGLDGAELETTPLDELPVPLIPAALAQIVLAGPDNENSFAHLLDGTAPDAQDNLDLDLLNRCLAKVGLETVLQERLANRLPLIPAVSTVGGQPNAAGRANGTCLVLDHTVDFEIANAEELSRYMQEGLQSRNDQASINTVVSDALAMIFTVIGLGNTAAGASGAAVLYAWDQLEQATGNLLPSLLTKVEFDLENGGRIPEDRMDGSDGGTTPPYPEWTDPRLYARSLGMDLTRSSLEAAIVLANFIPISGLPGAELLKAGSLEGANGALDQLDTADCWTIAPSTWGPIGDARDREYLHANFFGDSVTEIIEFGSFEPIALGSTLLRISTTDAFSGPSVSAEKNIDVVRKQVLMQAPTITTQPGQPVEVVASIVDSYRLEKLDWEYPGFVVNPTVTRTSDTDYKLNFTAPTDRTKFPFEVKAFSTSINLAPITPRREGKTEIKTEAGIAIAPRGRCLPNGEPLDLVAVVSGLGDGEDDSVNWSQFGDGNLVPGASNTAVYTAPPSGEGEVLIEATLVADSSVMDEVSILYGACEINLDVGWYAGSSSSDPDRELVVDQMKSAYFSGPLFPEPDDLLLPPANWWNGRNRSVSSENSGSYLQPVPDDMGVFHDLLLSTSSTISAELTSSSGGQASLSMSWNTGAECKPIPKTKEGVECSNGMAQFDWNPVFWIQVPQAGTYQARLTMSCTRTGSDGIFAVGAETSLFRHVGGSASPLLPNSGTTGPTIDGLNPFNAPRPDPLPFPVGQTDFVCEPGAAPIDVEATWELGTPADPSKPDTVAFVILVTSLFMSPVDPLVVYDPPVGTYDQSGTISASVSLVRTGP